MSTKSIRETIANGEGRSLIAMLTLVCVTIIIITAMVIEFVAAYYGIVGFGVFFAVFATCMTMAMSVTSYYFGSRNVEKKLDLAASFVGGQGVKAIEVLEATANNLAKTAELIAGVTEKLDQLLSTRTPPP